MEAIIVNFRRGRKTQNPRQMIIKVDGINSIKEASSLVKKKVSWTSSGKEPKEIKGEVSSSHGNKGCIKAIFERGLPGQAIGQKVKLE
jgi:large subunit ribosomal protein L35Ae